MDDLIIVRGGGDLATGTIHKLRQCGFPVLILEAHSPSAIRRNVAFCEAVYAGEQTVEGITCRLVSDVQSALHLIEAGGLPVLVDPKGESIGELRPTAVVDAILAKRNLGTRMDMAPVTVALGPGFCAGEDVHAVIETRRGHNLGRVIYHGEAEKNTGVPGVIGGYGKERVIHSPAAGVLRNIRSVTDAVKTGEVIAVVSTPNGDVPVTATLDGLLRGLIRDGFEVTKGFKIADIDPRMQEYDNCFTISDKARCIAGGVLEAVLHLRASSYQMTDEGRSLIWQKKRSSSTVPPA